MKQIIIGYLSPKEPAFEALCHLHDSRIIEKELKFNKKLFPRYTTNRNEGSQKIYEK